VRSFFLGGEVDAVYKHIVGIGLCGPLDKNLPYFVVGYLARGPMISNSRIPWSTVEPRYKYNCTTSQSTIVVVPWYKTMVIYLPWFNHGILEFCTYHYSRS